VNDLTQYLAIREHIKTGDLLQWQSNSLLGRLIRAKTQKDRRLYETVHDINVNHSSLAVRMIEESTGDLRVFTTESLEKGTVPAFLSVRLQQYDGKAWWYPLKEEWDSARIVISRRAFEYLGIGYDYWAIIKYLFNRTPKLDSKHLYCNEYCCLCWGVELDTAKSPNWLPNLEIFKNPVRIL